MSYDINLKKTQLGYQFDRNVYIGYQTNDNRVVTVKELKGYVGGSGGGGGGGGGGIQSITLSSDPSAGTVTLTVDGTQQSATVTNVTADSAAPEDATTYVCVIAESGTGYKVYPTDKTWNELLASIPQITWNATDQELLSIKVNGATKTLALGTGLKKTPNQSGNTTTLSVANNVVLSLSIGNNGLSYSDSDGNTHTLGGTIGTTPVTTLSIATKTATSPSDSDIVTVGYLNEKYQGGNVYSTEDTPDGQQTSDKNTRFIFVEV